MLAVHPDATIIERRLDNYPITVKVYGPDKVEIFSTHQRNLFSKYSAKRTESINQIRAAVAKY